jgi:hypothetical protein
MPSFTLCLIHDSHQPKCPVEPRGRIGVMSGGLDP